MQAKTYKFEKTTNSSMPVKSLRAGALQVAVWENETTGDDGQARTFKTVSFERRYKNREGKWQSTNNLRVNDLPKAALLLHKAYEYMVLTQTDEEY